MSYGGSVACKSPRCCYYYYNLKCLKPLQGEGRGEESGSLGKAREAWTHRDIHIQSDRLPGIVKPESVDVRSTPSCAEGENAIAMTMGPKQDKEEMFKFRSPLFHHLLFHGHGALGAV